MFGLDGQKEKYSPHPYVDINFFFIYHKNRSRRQWLRSQQQVHINISTYNYTKYAFFAKNDIFFKECKAKI